MIHSAMGATAASLRRFARDEGGTTAIEYAIIAMGISIAIVGAIVTLGANVKGFYTSIAVVL